MDHPPYAISDWPFSHGCDSVEVFMRVPPPIAIAFRALRRNRLQTSLTIIGMTIGVAAVLAMIAIGTGAEAAIEDQIRAAGMNLIVVTAGNYKVKATDDFGGGAVEPSAGLRRRDDVAQGFEDEEQRSQRGCIARRMQPDFHHGLLNVGF